MEFIYNDRLNNILTSPLGIVFVFIIFCSLLGYIKSLLKLIEGIIFHNKYREKIKKELIEEIRNKELELKNY